VGLGNPGKTYAPTRHNLGARVVDELRRNLNAPAFRLRSALRARVSAGERLLAIPTTFMNDSGRAVRALARRFRTPLDHLLVVHDEKDLAFGKLKLQRNRSSAGHRGAQSIIAALGSQNFWRLRIGIGSPPAGIATDTFVLAPFTAAENRKIQETIIREAESEVIALL